MCMPYTKSSFSSSLAAALLACATVGTLAAQRTLYVSPVGSNQNDGSSEATAFATISLATRLAQPGDTVLVMPGDYRRETPGNQWDEVNVGRAGRAGQYITIRGVRDAEGRRPRIISTQRQALSTYQKSYIVIEGLELTIGEEDDQGHRSSSDPNFGEESWLGRVGIAMNSSHHIIARDCYIHDFPGNAINCGGSDVILIEDCVFEHNGYLASNANSGLSFYQLRDRGVGDLTAEGYPGYHVVVRNCVARYNVNLRNFVAWSPTNITDGNGIIVDDLRRTQGSGGAPYPHRTLLLGNQCYGNGGPGINIYESDHVDLYHNSLADNGQSSSLANQAFRIVASNKELQVYEASDIRVVNNLLYATDDDRLFIGGGNREDFVVRSNLVFSTEVDASTAIVPEGENNFYADPQVVSVEPMTRLERELLARTRKPYNLESPQATLREPTVSRGFPIQDLRLTAGSPAIDAGEDLRLPFWTTVGAPDVGAFEFDGSSGLREAAPVTHDLTGRLHYDGAEVRVADLTAGVRVFVYDASGRMVYGGAASSDGDFGISASDFAAGPLTVEVRQGGERWVGRVVIH